MNNKIVKLSFQVIRKFTCSKYIGKTQDKKSYKLDVLNQLQMSQDFKHNTVILQASSEGFMS